MIEIWDAYDGQLNKLEGIDLVRGEKIPDGMYHLVSEIIVRHDDGTYLLMQRDFNKHLGGKWELSAGGSALKGETPMECARRELQEETGIAFGEMKELGRILHEGHHSLYVEYLCVTDWDKHAIRLQVGETVNYRWVDKNEILRMESHELASSRALEFIHIC